MHTRQAYYKPTNYCSHALFSSERSMRVRMEFLTEMMGG
jgi:hypothetical protein